MVTLHDTPKAQHALDQLRAKIGAECVTITPVDDPSGKMVVAISVDEEMESDEVLEIEQAIYSLTPYATDAARFTTETDGAPGAFYIGDPIAIRQLRMVQDVEDLMEWAMEVDTPTLQTALTRLQDILTARSTPAATPQKPTHRRK